MGLNTENANRVQCVEPRNHRALVPHLVKRTRTIQHEKMLVQPLAQKKWLSRDKV